MDRVLKIILCIANENHPFLKLLKETESNLMIFILCKYSLVNSWESFTKIYCNVNCSSRVSWNKRNVKQNKRIYACQIFNNQRRKMTVCCMPQKITVWFTFSHWYDTAYQWAKFDAPKKVKLLHDLAIQYADLWWNRSFS